MWAEITARAGILLIGAVGVGAVLQYIDGQPEGRKPWGEADLEEPGIHLFTSTHLRALRGNADACLAALDGSDMQFTRAGPSTSTTAACHWQAGVRIERSNVGYASPAPDIASCALAATLYVWEREILQPAAAAHLGSEVVEILHYGTFSCRRVNGA
ncbi:MAG: extensin family protein, partial [Rhodobacteraceae bacterium]|nr:extensin family protein [Paracoccaceae bacterium]